MTVERLDPFTAPVRITADQRAHCSVGIESAGAQSDQSSAQQVGGNGSDERGRPSGLGLLLRAVGRERDGISNFINALKPSLGLNVLFTANAANNGRDLFKFGAGLGFRRAVEFGWIYDKTSVYEIPIDFA